MLKEKINHEFVTAFKAKNTFRKDTIGSLKAKITETEKKQSNVELKDEEIYGVIASLIKQREQAIEIYSKNDSEQAKLNAQKEEDEIVILKEFLPAQLTDEEINEILSTTLSAVNSSDMKKMLGNVMKYFNTYYKGQFDNKKLKEIFEKNFVSL